jgi:N-acetylglucosaminyl-diphospho-decaprenol L-rhamnosyltransferase
VGEQEGLRVVSAEPEIRVVVVTFRSGEVIGSFLDTLAKATARSYEVVIVDNSPELDDGTAAAARRPEARLVRPGRNLGYGAACNRGAAGARGGWVVISNADIAFAAGALDELIDAGGRWPAGGAFGPGIVNPDGALYPSARDLPSLSRGIGHALFGWFWPTNPWTASYRRERGTPTEMAAGWLSGSVQLLRREAFESVAGFDESYFMFMEDVDLNRRMGLSGWSSVYVPSAVVEHLGGHSTKRTSRRMVIAHHRSMVRYLNRQYSAPALLPLRVALTTGLGARLLVALAFAKDSAGARATRSADALTSAGSAARKH